MRTTSSSSSSGSSNHKPLAVIGTSITLPRIRSREELYECIINKMQMSVNFIENGRHHPR